MLVLRRDWSSVSSGAIIENLVNQVPEGELRAYVATEFAAASLDLVAATWPCRDGHRLTVETVSDNTWRVRNLYFMYLREDKVATIEICVRLSLSSEVTAIVPRQCEGSIREKLLAALGDDAPNIWTLPNFISWRTMWAAVDQGWPPRRAVLEMLAAYNSRILLKRESDSLCAEIPCMAADFLT